VKGSIGASETAERGAAVDLNPLLVSNWSNTDASSILMTATSITPAATAVARRYLTKVRFKLALECPTKLHYYKNKAYADKFSAANSSQATLAEEGLLIGELAKYKYWPDPTAPKNFVTISEVNQVKAHNITRQVLLANCTSNTSNSNSNSNSNSSSSSNSNTSSSESNSNCTSNTSSNDASVVVIAEGAALHNGLFIRADILVVTGKTIKLVEVKSKSVSGGGGGGGGKGNVLDELLTKQGLPKAKWLSTFYDLAFQTYVMQCAYPDYTIVPSLLLVDKDATVDQSGINEWFSVTTSNKSTRIQCNKTDLIAADFKKSLDILVEVPVAAAISKLIRDVPVPVKGEPLGSSNKASFAEFVQWCSATLLAQEGEGEVARHWTAPVLTTCKACAFQRSDPGPDNEDKSESKGKGKEEQVVLKCGLSECWSHHKWYDINKNSPLTARH
jgi:hypothetical protein